MLSTIPYLPHSHRCVRVGVVEDCSVLAHAVSLAVASANSRPFLHPRSRSAVITCPGLPMYFFGAGLRLGAWIPGAGAGTHRKGRVRFRGGYSGHKAGDAQLPGVGRDVRRPARLLGVDRSQHGDEYKSDENKGL